MMRRGVLSVLALATALPCVAQAQRDTTRSWSFAVLGHIRGDHDGKLNPKLDELLERVRPLRPDFVVLTGDIIHGDIHRNPPDTAIVRREWDQVDSALATLGVPIYRVPGNHDISDRGTKRLWWQRYGPLPQVLERFGSRFLLLGSAWIPADADTVRQIVPRPAALDAAQTDWLKVELARRGSWAHSFVILHHLLWWETGAPWWRDIHPLLPAAGVAHVFSGDYGPLKFSHLERDSVVYVQSSMEGFTSLRILQDLEASRVLSAQFDNFLQVRVEGASVDVRVHTLGEWSSPQYQPEFFRAMMTPNPVPLRERMRALLQNPRKLALLAALGLAALAAGFFAGRMLRRTGR